MSKLQLEFGLSQDDLYTRAGLARIDGVFDDYLRGKDWDAHVLLSNFRENPQAFSDDRYDFLMCAVAPWMTSFLLKLFAIETDYYRLYSDVSYENILLFRQSFLSPISKVPDVALSDQDFETLTEWLCHQVQTPYESLTQNCVIEWAVKLCSKTDLVLINQLRRWCLEAQRRYAAGSAFLGWFVFWRPLKIGQLRLHATIDADMGSVVADLEVPLSRDDFTLVESQWCIDQAAIHVDYCQYCHDRSVDYCRTGFLQKKGDLSQGYRQNRQGQTLLGCPLDQKISQMHWFMRHQQPMSAWIITMIDNPFCLITGHRICNDCMQSCIYQKQDPVDTPQVESRIVSDMLDLRWGVELYDLLMKWHPLRKRDAVPCTDNNHRVLVMGLGPAGFSMMHYLWMQGCSVTGMDGAQLEPWPYGDVMQPVEYFSSLKKPLDRREKLGFGGVCEYGITSRWDKNLLSVIYLSLLRRQNCFMMGNCRFGGTVTVEDAWKLGFSHLVLALGAGLPKALNVSNSLAKGMHQASDFLMSLHTLGAQWENNKTSLALNLPCVVIGAGLTAVDTATEAQAYYLYLVQLVYHRLSKLISLRGESVVKSYFSEQEYDRLNRWFSHGQLVVQEKRAAARDGRSVCFRALLEAWGGVSMVYRRAIEFAPAYRNNHDELQSALNAGIAIYTHRDVCSVDVDGGGHVTRLRCLQPWSLSQEWGAVSLNNIEFYHDFCRCYVDSSDQLFTQGMIIGFSEDASLDEQTFGYWQVISVSSTTIDLKLWWGQQGALRSFRKPYSVLRISEPKRDGSLSARTILVATGSQPNTAFEYEHRGHFNRSGAFYQLNKLDQDGLTHIPSDPSEEGAFFTSYRSDDKRVSVIGDLHPRFHGSVVKALASSRAAAHDILRHLDAMGPLQSFSNQFLNQMADLFSARLLKKDHLLQDYHLFVVRAPWVVQKFQPGMMLKLQAYVFGSSGTVEAFGCEAVNCQPFDYDVAAQTLSFVLCCDKPAHRALCHVPEGGLVSLMGPSGVGLSKKVLDQRVMLIADEERIFSACLYRKHYAGLAHSVDFFVQYSDLSKHLLDAVGQTHYVKWLPSCQESYFNAEEVAQCAVIIIHGGFKFVKSCYENYCRAVPLHSRSTKIIGYVGGPMQCMLKGICAQCLQWQIDPDTGLRTKAVFACSWQDQPLELVDLSHCQQRHDQCQAFKILNMQWFSNNDVGYSIAR